MKEGEAIGYNINEDFRMDPDKFLGVFRNVQKGYSIEKSYLVGRGHQIQLYSTRVTPKETPVGTVCLVHGFAEHSGRYLHVMEDLAMAGYQVLALDLRGFGYSGGPRGSCTVVQLHQDIHTLLEQAQPELPLFLMGFSMGGMLVASFLLNNKVNVSGAILVNPLIEVPSIPSMPMVKQILVKSGAEDLKDIVANSLINPTSLTKCPPQFYSIFKDTMNLPYLGVHFAKYLIECTEFLQDNGHRFQTPLLMLLGEQDGLLDHTKALRFYQQVSFTDKQLRKFPQGYHEMHNDREFPEVMSAIREFIDARKEKKVGEMRGGMKYGYSVRPLKVKRRLLLLALLLGLLLRLLGYYT